MTQSILGIIGGSGFYNLPGLDNPRWEAVASPWGAPSDQILFAEIAGLPIRFLPRHGRGHKLSPSGIDYRANIDAMKRAGVTDLVSISACGSFREELPPGHFVLVDQFIDRTRGRTSESTFFSDGCVAHAHFADPVWEPLRQVALQASRAAGATAHDGGTYLCMEGPLFSTRAESRLYRSWGVDVIGMTNLQEAKLAREAEIAYTTIALVTDYDCWHASEADVDVTAVLAVIKQNVDLARRVVAELAKGIAANPPISAAGCMQHAVMTHKDRVSADARRRLQLLVGRYLG